MHVADRRESATPPTDITIRDRDWNGEAVRGEVHVNTAFLDCDLSEATTTGSVFTGCTFRNTRFNASAHQDTGFVNCAFVGCSFFSATLIRCKLVGSRFERCTFGMLKVIEGDWSLVGLRGADLRSASFRHVRMREVDLTGARCDGATVTDVDLSGAWLHEVSLAGTDLRRSVFDTVDPIATRMAGAIVTVEQAVVIASALSLDVRAD